MADRKREIRFFTVADFEEEERWLREENRNGWRLEKMTPPFFYSFERCTPEDVIYRLDYRNNTETHDYMQMVEDFGWEYCGRCFGWLYFRKPVSEIDSENDGNLFSDSESRINRIEEIRKTRLLPLLVIFLCCVIPNCIRFFDGHEGLGFALFWIVMFAIYVYLLVHGGLKLKKMKRELEEKSER